MTKSIKKPSKRGKKTLKKHKSLHCPSEIIQKATGRKTGAIKLFGDDGWFSRTDQIHQFLLALNGIFWLLYELIKKIIDVVKDFQ